MMPSSTLTIPGVVQIPENLTVISSTEKRVQAMRHDGLVIILDRESDDTSQLLNQIRLFAPPAHVIHAVGLVRGFQISITYSRRYRKETLSLLEREFEYLKTRLGSHPALIEVKSRIANP